MRRNSNLITRLDWISVTLYVILVIFGWVNLYAANFNPEQPVFFDTNKEYFKQLIWLGLSFVLIWIISLTDSKFFVEFAYVFLGIAVFLLLMVLIFGREVNGAKSWFEIGPLRIQPAEFTKVAVNLSIARAISRFNFSFKNLGEVGKLGLIILMPILLIFLQNDTGSALVYFVFLLVFYREGMSPLVLITGLIAGIVTIMTLMMENSTIYIILGIGIIIYLFIRGLKRTVYQAILAIAVMASVLFVLIRFAGLPLNLLQSVIVITIVLSVYFLIVSYRKKIRYVATTIMLLWAAISFSYGADYFFHNILSKYQLTRIHVLMGIEDDPLGAGYNVNQSKIAIGSGGVTGKGFLQGTQTKFNFVPEQSTDFIFCTVGEEWGFLGTSLVVILFIALLFRLLKLAERQHSVFSRVYGYGVVSILFFHFAINIGMTIGLAPVIGIPLPFFSYGGSSLWGFTMLLFIFLKLDTNRTELIR
jgi:rod shape determining protein RodA